MSVNLDDSLYISTPEHPSMVHCKPSPIDLTNKLCFFPLPELGTFLNTINGVEILLDARGILLILM